MTFQPFGVQPEKVNERAVTVLARDAEGRIFCQLRDDRPGIAAPGQWCLFGGKVEAGESLAQAARREFREETGCDFEEQYFTPLAKTASSVKPDWEIYFLELREPVSPEQIRLGEGAGFAFLTLAQIRRMEFVPNYALFFRTFFD